MSVTIINTLEAKEQFTDLINRVAHGKERVILTRRGKEIAAIISLEDLIILKDALDNHDLNEAIDSLKEARSEGTISLNDLKEDLGY